MPAPIVPAVIGYGAQMLYSEHQSNKQQRQNIEMMKLSNSIGRQNLIDSPTLTVQGLENAGLSPAMAQGNFGDVAQTPSPANSSIPSAPSMDVIGALLAKSQIKQSDAAADKMKAEAEGQEIKNSEEKQKNVDAPKFIRNSLDNIINAYHKAGLNSSYYQNLRDILNDKSNAGTIAAILNSAAAETNLSKVTRSNIGDALDTLVDDHKIDYAEDIAKMSHLQRKMLEKQITLAAKTVTLTSEQIKNVKGDTRKKEQEFYNLIDEQKKLNEEIKNLVSTNKLTETQAEQIRDNNFIGAIRNHDWLPAGVNGAFKLLEAILSVLTKKK